MQRLSYFVSVAGPEKLSSQEADWLHQLMADWQVLADLSMADLTLWLPTADNRFVAVSHCRPATAPTIHVDDVIGLYMSRTRIAEGNRAWQEQRVCKSAANRWVGTFPVTEYIVPVVFEGSSIALMTCEMFDIASTVGSAKSQWFAGAAAILRSMITRGEFPYDNSPGSGLHGNPRVADGVLLIEEDGNVQEISPNGVSCFRRLGITSILPGKVLAEEITQHMEDSVPIDETMAVVIMGRASWRTEIEMNDASVTIRALPLTDNGRRLGAILLCRDVSEMRRHQRELMSKDATIREIHHRVKNNLQTVSALLRLQARRSEIPDVKQALAEAERRVSTIATIHEALSQNVDETVDFDPVVRQVLRLAASIATSEGNATAEISGTFGRVNADAASALAVVLAELVTNAVEHGLEGKGGTVQVSAERDGRKLSVKVEDDGVGIDPGHAGAGLGTQIVRTLVESELAGTIAWEPGTDGGTTVVIRCNIKEVIPE